MSQVERFRRQAQACRRLGSPLYAELLGRAADDLDDHGLTEQVLAGHEHSPAGAAVSLRLLGTVHRLVLAGEAPDLAGHYPSAGGTYVSGDAAADEEIWRAFRQVLTDRREEVREGLTRPPQTNETGRSLPLLGALGVISARTDGLPVRLVEIGASAGLNLRADALRGVHRPADLAGLPSAPPYVVTERLGCDPDPIDATTEDGRLTLLSYVWPDDTVRTARLRAALDVAATVPVDLRRCSAAELLREVELTPGAATVLWHSVMWQYLDDPERASVLEQVARLQAAAGVQRPFAHVSFEPPARDSADFEVRLRWAAGRTPSDELIGTAPPHGVPVGWTVDS